MTNGRTAEREKKSEGRHILKRNSNNKVLILSVKGILERLRGELLPGRVTCVEDIQHTKNITRCIFSTTSELCTVLISTQLSPGNKTKIMQLRVGIVDELKLVVQSLKSDFKCTFSTIN